MFIRCDACLGKKKLIGMGFIQRDCETCKGVGQIFATQELLTKKIQKIHTKLPHDVKKSKKRIIGKQQIDLNKEQTNE